MGVRFACHECGKALNIKSSLAGKRGKCPFCGAKFRIPISDQPFSIPLEEQQLADDQPLEDAQQEDDGQPEIAPQASQQTSPPNIANQSVATAAAVKPTAAEPHFDPLEDPRAQWYVRPPNGGRYGPADGPTVRQWIREGRVTRTTLLWRDGWAQWRDCDEIIPEAFADLPEATNPKVTAPPAVATAAASGVDFAATQRSTTQKSMPGTGAPSNTGASSSSTPSADDYLGAKKRRRSRQRVTLISILAGIAVILIVALVVALAWPR